ncbi:MAG TPA: adenylate/guanylate cyclase domain-containing protein [Lysobacter sp.]
MPLRDDLENETARILGHQWTIRDGTVVPTTPSVLLNGGGVKLDAVMLYADLAESTKLAISFDRRVTAKVVKSFLSASCRIIRAHNGNIRSFDGDRVMAVFLGSRKNTESAIAALKINWTVRHLLRPKIHAQYPTLAAGGFEINHGVGIDRGDVLVVRSGIRDNNDLIWIGRAPNVAAKLANLRTGHPTYITSDVFDRLAEDGKLGGNPRRLMWEECNWSVAPTADVARIYRSTWTWAP